MNSRFHNTESLKKNKKLLRRISKNKQLNRRFHEYIDDIQSSRNIFVMPTKVVPPNHDRAANRKRKIHETDSDFDEDVDGFYEDRLPENYVNRSLREVYKKKNGKGDLNTSSPSNTVIQPSCSPSTNVSPSECGELNSKTDSERSVIENTRNAIKIQKKKLKKQHVQGGTGIDISSEFPTVTFKDVGGCTDTLTQIDKTLVDLRCPKSIEVVGIRSLPKGLLLYGPSGCGKSLIAHAVAGEFKLPLIEIAASEIISGISGESEKKLGEIFAEATCSAPCILFFDQLDAIVPNKQTSDREFNIRIVSQFQKCMDKLNVDETKPQVLVIGATNRLHAVDMSLRSPGRFSKEIYIDIPNENGRLQILQKICQNVHLSPLFELQWLAENTPGYVGGDLKAVVYEACSNAQNRFANSIADDLEENFFVEKTDFESALKSYVPCVKKEGFATIPEITWEDVGALKNIKEQLQEAILWPIKYRQEFLDYKLREPSGVLLCGPKGCGKTMLAKAVANECGINFLSVKGAEFLNLYVGETERSIRECFQRARNAAPCVIFFDEIEAICPTRSNSSRNPASQSIVNTLLTEIDGIDKKAGKRIFVMGATNQPNNIDSAMLRPGRLEQVLYVGLPNQVDRYEILQTTTKNGPNLAHDVNLREISQDKRCEGFSGADLASLCGKASMIALREHITLDKKSDFVVRSSHFESAFAVVKPSVSGRDARCFAEMNISSPKEPPHDLIIGGNICNKF